MSFAGARIIVVFQLLVLLTSTSGAVEGPWRYAKRRVASKVRPLSLADARPLMGQVCTDPLRRDPAVGLGCPVRKLGPSFDFQTEFHPSHVIYGHFLSADSEDAMIGGWSYEGHPLLWGGTLLVSRRGGTWTPIWYRSTVITHSCDKTALPDGREILLCEEEDSGMSHAIHYLFTVDGLNPADRRKRLLLTADSYSFICSVTQTEVIEEVRWQREAKERMLLVTLRHGKRDYTPKEITACQEHGISLRALTRSETLRFVVTLQGIVPEPRQ